MKLQEYDEFVRRSDWTTGKSASVRIKIARYGLAAEIGSLAAVIKRKVLHHSAALWDRQNDEIIDELGDCLWYATQLSIIDGGGGLVAMVRADLTALPREIEARPSFRAALPPGNYQKFCQQSPAIVDLGKDAEIDEYQSVAILTARTQGQELLDVCVTRLLLYATSTMSRQFPEAEYFLKDDIIEFSKDRTMAMVLWHLSALAWLYKISLSSVMRRNMEKLDSIGNLYDHAPTPLFDTIDGVPESQRFPKKFEVVYISTSSQRAQMFYRGRRLGDELDDNYLIDDGYRFHDALHLSNAAVLGWSPVLRSLMGLKRKYDPSVDRTEDGARARIVEEAVVKAIHSEVARIAAAEGVSKQYVLSGKRQISYQFLKLVMTFVEGLEVAASKMWEWQEAIRQGHDLYTKLHEEGQGTVTIDLEKRAVTFSPLVLADTRGPVVDAVVDSIELDSSLAMESNKMEKERVERKAILRILGLSRSPENMALVDISLSESNQISIKTKGAAQKAQWDRSIIGFRRRWTYVGKSGTCLMMAVGVPD